MAIPVIMSRQGQSVESCIITKWNKKVGDTVAVGDILFTYETDKATFDEEAKDAGVLLAILHQEGDDVPCLENVCVIGAAGEDVSSFTAGAQEAPAEAPAPAAEAAAPAAAQAPAPVQAAAAAAQGDIKISPRARNYAEKTGVDYRFAVPTGAEGRIMERDVQLLREQGVMATGAAAAGYMASDKQLSGTGIGGRVSLADLAAGPAPAAAAAPAEAAAPQAAYTDVKLTNIRKVISKSMMGSLQGMAQLTLNASFDATEILAYRKKMKENAEKLGLANITLNDIVLYAVSRTLLNHKALNAHLLDDTMRYFTDVNLGMAVDTERGLMVPTIFGCNKLSLNEIATATKSLASDCQKGSISPDKLSGGTFTVSNLGSLGIESFTPVINPPQTGILGVCTTVNRVREVGGVLKTYPCMTLSLTFDHRAIDGAPAAKFLKELCTNLENFSALLAK